MTQPFDSSTNPALSTISRPPAQVFTKGSTGAVKTTRQGSNHSMTPTRQSRPSTRHAPHDRKRSTSANHQSRGRYYTNTREDDNVSVSSAPTYSPKKIPSVELKERPISARKQSVVVHKEPSVRDESPVPSQDSQKHHIRTAKRVIEDLNRAQGTEGRIAAITSACDKFDHSDEAKHNIELYQGAAQALAKLLQTTTSDDEIRMLCAALEMVFRGSSNAVQGAYEKLNMVFVPTLLRLLDRSEVGNMKHGEISILNISRILLCLSKCTELRAGLCRKQGMLETMTRITTRVLNPDCRLARIRIMSNLASCPENKILMYEHEGLVDSVLRIAHLDLSDVARQYAGAILMEFASEEVNQVSMGHNEKIMGTLVKMVLLEKTAPTRDSVITALQSIAFNRENRDCLVSFKSGIVLEALKKVLSSDLDAKARRRAAGTLLNLACDETAERMGNHKGLLDSLAVVASTDESLEVQERAASALTKIAGCVTCEMDCHEAILDALVVASLSKKANGVPAILRVKARDPDNRESMARHPGVLDTLADICLSTGSEAKHKDNAIRAIMHLVNENKNRKLMCNKTILDALVFGAAYEDTELEEARDSAIIALERLATEVSNRPHMARHPKLLPTVATAVEREAHWEDAGKESEHGYLAKPLLMSLLLTM